jgi:hypothetical protein
MVRAICLSLFLLTASRLFAQNCTTYVVVDTFDGKTRQGIDDLKAGNFQAKAGNVSLPVVSAMQNFDNRVLVLLQKSVSPEKQKVQEQMQEIADLVRQAPAGRAIAFGVFAEKAFISSEFSADPEKRAIAVDAVLAQAAQLPGKKSAVFDSLHQALAVFGPRQPGDTILLMSDGVDHSSKRNPSDLSKEFTDKGTRLLVVLQSGLPLNFTNYFPENHRSEYEKGYLSPALKSLSKETGGAYRYYEAGKLLEFAWAGYLLGVQTPVAWDTPREWQLALKDANGKIDKKALLLFPQKLTPCDNAVTAAVR